MSQGIKRRAASGYVKLAGIGLLSGIASGAVVLGVGGRLAMRLVALMASTPTGFTMGGTLEVIGTGTLMGAASGPLYVFLRQVVPSPRLVKGAAFGALLFVCLVALPPPAARSAVSGIGHPLTPILFLFGALFVGYGLALAAVVERLRPDVRILFPPQRRRQVSSNS